MFGDRHHGDGARAAGIEPAQIGEQIGRRLVQIAGGAEIQRAVRALRRLGAEGKQRLAADRLAAAVQSARASGA